MDTVTYMLGVPNIIILCTVCTHTYRDFPAPVIVIPRHLFSRIHILSQYLFPIGAAAAEMGGVVPFRKLQGPLKEQEIRIIAGEVPPDLGMD